VRTIKFGLLYLEDAFSAIDKLHSIGPSVVIITSLEYGDKSFIPLVGSIQSRDSAVRRFRMKVPRLNRSFTGTGDLFSALVLAWHSIDGDIVCACEKAINSLYSVLLRTMNTESKELQLIQSKKDLETPQTVFKAEVLENSK